MIVSVVNVGLVVDALEQQLREWPTLSNATIEDSEPVNENPDRCPWVGLYRSQISFPVRTLGMGSGYRRQRISLIVAMNETSSQSGEDCKNRLETLAKGVCDAIASDESIRGNALAMEDIDLTYTDYSRDGAAFMQHAVLRFTVETPVTVTP